MRRLALALAAVAAVAPGVATAAGPRFSGVDTSGYPTVRATVVTPVASERAPALTENGKPVVGLQAVNLGRGKSVVLVVDRSRSMKGAALADATAAARAFVSAKPEADRIAVVTFGSRATALTGFSTARIDADSVLASLEIDRRQGTALYDGVVAAAEAVGGESLQARVIILLTDGADVSSQATSPAALTAASAAGASVYAIGIEGKGFRSDALRRLADGTGGRYFAAADSGALTAVYASIAGELARTWQLSYVTSARPGERLELAAAGTKTTVVAPGASMVVPVVEPALPDAAFRVGPLVTALAVAACIFLAALLLLKAPAGSELRRRLSPHLGERERKRARGPVQERFATASTVMRATEKAFGHLRAWHWLHRLLERADLPLRTVELAYISVGAGLGLGLVTAAGGTASGVTLVAIAAGGTAPVFFVWFKAKRRLTALEDQLPDLLTTLAASLKAGHSFRQGIQAVVDEGAEPASKEFKRVLTETSLGRPMDDALAEMAERVGSENLSFVVTAVTIQRQVGGSLAGIFDMVAEAVRQPAAVRAQDQVADRDGEDVRLRPARAPVLHRRRADADEPGVHGSALPHLVGPHADHGRPDDDVLRHPRPQENRLLQGLIRCCSYLPPSSSPSPPT